MNLETILNDKEKRQMLDKYICQFYTNFSVTKYMDKEDFEQEIYLYLIKHLKNFDSEKASLSTFLYMLIKTKTRNLLRHFKCKSNEMQRTKKSLGDKYCNKHNSEFELNEVLADELIDIEKDIADNETMNEIISLFDDEEMKNIILLLTEGYNKREICKKLNFGYTKLFNKLGNECKKGTIKHIIKSYYRKEDLKHGKQ